MAVKPVPEGYSTVTPYLTLDDANAAIEFYKRAFGAEEKVRMPGPDGKIMHAELQIGNSMVMLSDYLPDMGGNPTAKILGGSPVNLMLYVENADEFYDRAVLAGAESTMPLADMFWGDRFGKVKDPYGLTWMISTHIEDVSPEEMDKRAAAAMSSPQ
jgi:PhnB protein